MTGITPAQYDTLMKPINGTRIAKRSIGGKQLSYLESWDVRAHLIRTFGFGNFDVETLSTEYLGTHAYEGKDDKPMVETSWRAIVQLTLRDPNGVAFATYSEGAVGSATGGAVGAGIGDLHDNALKSAVSDALKRCAINLGSQFGLSLYDDGTTREVVKGTLVHPEGWQAPESTEEQEKILAASLGATKVGEEPA